MNKGVVFDLDGTIYCGNEIVPYTLETISELKANDFEIIFFTNNSTKTRLEIFQKLQKLGIETELNRVYTSSFATAKYLNENDMKRVYLIGSEGFKQELNNFTIECVDSCDVEAVIIGLDLDFNYHKISMALEAINKGAKLIVCNRDKNYPIENNVLRPGCNAMVSSILGSCDNKLDVDYLVGKPNVYLLESICKDWNLDKNLIYVVGDSEESDIAMAKNFGVNSILVGTNSENKLKDIVNIIQGSRK